MIMNKIFGNHYSLWDMYNNIISLTLRNKAFLLVFMIQ
jgi:hypothetical protein